MSVFDVKGVPNVATLKFLLWLREMEERVKHGFVPFSRYTGDSDCDGVLYDDSSKVERNSDGDDCFPLVCDCCVDENHHDIISWFDDLMDPDSFRVRVVHNLSRLDDPNEPEWSLEIWMQDESGERCWLDVADCGTIIMPRFGSDG